MAQCHKTDLILAYFCVCGGHIFNGIWSDAESMVFISQIVNYDFPHE
jgi:hypothetical protein